MNYVEVVFQIYQWLANLQIRQKQISAKVKNGYLHFQLIHPVQGNIAVKQSFPNDTYFRTNGIGLKLIEKKGEDAIIEVYDSGGIWDPVDKFVPGDHYATTHFAFLGAIIYKHYRKEKEILENVKLAIEFHLRTSADEYYFGDYGYHWDFQNYAFLETFNLLKDDLLEHERVLWLNGLKKYIENNRNRHTNWIAMRSYSALMRYFVFHSIVDKLRFYCRLSRVYKARKKDGCYDDFPNMSRPIQYHVFTVALLHRIYLLKPTKKLKRKIISGIDYFLKFVDPEGCFNYFGRGQEQIFGYGLALYVLEAGQQLDPEQRSKHAIQRNKIWKYLYQFKTTDHFPLVLNSHKDEEKFGWYDYHHTTVYNAFLGAWLGLSALLNNKDERKTEQKIKSNFCYNKPSRTIIVSNEEYFIAFSGGMKSYLSEAGLTPLHIWFKDVGHIFSCPGGPSKEKFGKLNPMENVEKNYLAPIFQLENGEWLTPAKKEFDLKVLGNNVIFFYFDYGSFVIKRRVTFEPKKIEFNDQIKIQSNIKFREIRYFNFPLNIDKFLNTVTERMIIQDKLKKNKLGIYLEKDGLPINSFEKSERVRSATGNADVHLFRDRNVAMKKGDVIEVVFSMEKIS